MFSLLLLMCCWMNLRLVFCFISTKHLSLPTVILQGEEASMVHSDDMKKHWQTQPGGCLNWEKWGSCMQRSEQTTSHHLLTDILPI